METQNLVEMRGITKRYSSGTLANDRVSFSLKENEIHAVAGENGAGKSTLMKILFGVEQPDAGTIIVNGQAVTFHTPRDAMAMGIGMVYQHFMLVDELPVWQNLFLGAEKMKGPFLDQEAMIAETNRLCQLYDMPLDPQALCGQLPVSARQKVEILKVLARNAKVLILDEPTAVLTPQETEQLFRQLRLLRDAGHTIVIITHKLKEMKALCDRVTVMRGGKTVGVYQIDEITEQKLSELMVGGSVRLHVQKTTAHPGKAIAGVRDLTITNPNGKRKLDQVSFDLHAGEILCLVGVEGNGQQQVVECMTGEKTNYEGSITFNGTNIRNMPVKALRRLGMSHIPEDRMIVGTDQQASIYHNLLATRFEEEAKLGFLKTQKLRAQCQEAMKKFMIKGALNDSLASLSGGNMQKVVLAREFSDACTMIVADQPTRGVDVGAISFIHDQLIKMRDEGKAILLVSADLGEVLDLADRILVFREGRIAAQIDDPAAVDEQILGRYMLGVEEKEHE